MKKISVYLILLILPLLVLASCGKEDDKTEGEVKPNNIKIILPSEHDNQLIVGESFEVEVLVLPENAVTKDYTLTSSSDALKVEGNKITATNLGEATLTATINDTELSASVLFKITNDGEAPYVEASITDLLAKKEADLTTIYRVKGILSEDHLFDGKENRFGMAYLVDDEGNAIRIYRSTLFSNIISKNDGLYSYDKNHAFGEEAFTKIPFGAEVTLDVLVDIHGVDKKPMIAGYYVDYSNCSDCKQELPFKAIESENGTFEVKSNKYNHVGIISCKPNENYVVDKVLITYVDGTTVEGRLDPNLENSYHFTVNAYQTIEVTFKQK